MSENMHASKKAQSIIVGGLISSAGIFFAKFIGLFYAIPFNTLLGSEENIAYYGVAFQMYSYLLNICTAGFPFAIATLIAKYAARGDFQTTVLIKKLSLSLMMLFGFGMMVIVMVCSGSLASLVLPKTGNDAGTMQLVLILISFALFFVPILSAIRGFYQGLKQMDIYALSQVLEQIARVAILLLASAIAVYVLGKDQVWSLYFGVLSASIAALLAILHLVLYDRKQMRKIRLLARKQEVVAHANREVITKELVCIAFPYLLVAILGYSDTIINTMFLNTGLRAYGNTPAEILLISGTINFGVLKLMSIPMILAPGFSSAIIPHLTTAITKNDVALVRKNIRDCIDIVIYIGLPISFCLFVYAKPFIDILFPPADPANFAMSAQILSWFSIEAFLNTLGPIFTALLMAVGLRRLNIRNLAIMVIVKFTIAFPLIKYFGYQGIVFSSMLAMGLFILLDAYALSTRFRMQWIYTFRKILVIVVSMLVLFGVASLCTSLGLKGYGAGRVVSFIQLTINGVLSLMAYFAITYIFQIPQTIFHFRSANARTKRRR